MLRNLATRDIVVGIGGQEIPPRKEDRIVRNAPYTPLPHQRLNREHGTASVIETNRVTWQKRHKRFHEPEEVRPISLILKIVVVFFVVRALLRAIRANHRVFDDERALLAPIKA
jgi:hypothetical protein